MASALFSRLFCNALPGFMLQASSWAVSTVGCMASLVSAQFISPQSNSLTDCIAGVLIGAALWWAKVAHGDYLDSFVINGSVWAPIVVMFVTIFLIRVHPEPADACCKCFEDGVAFAGVFIGIKFAQWHHPISHTPQVPGLSPAPVAIYFLKLAAKVVLGTNRINSE
jgi:hypothetical protein